MLQNIPEIFFGFGEELFGVSLAFENFVNSLDQLVIDELGEICDQVLFLDVGRCWLPKSREEQERPFFYPTLHQWEAFFALECHRGINTRSQSKADQTAFQIQEAVDGKTVAQLSKPKCSSLMSIFLGRVRIRTSDGCFLRRPSPEGVTLFRNGWGREVRWQKQFSSSEY